MPQREKQLDPNTETDSTTRVHTLKLSPVELQLLASMVEGAQIPGRAAQVYLSLRNKVIAEVRIP